MKKTAAALALYLVSLSVSLAANPFTPGIARVYSQTLGNAETRMIEFLPGGQILVVLVTENKTGTGHETYVARLLSDGTQDQTFGQRGVAQVDQARSFSEPHALTVQPDGRILVGGATCRLKYDSCQYFITRLNVNGSPDRSFGVDGQISFSFIEGIQNQTITGLFVRTDRKIWAVGRELFLLNEDGTFDLTFGQEGRFDFNYPYFGEPLVNFGWNHTHALADGKFLIVGRDSFNASTIIRMSADGTLDQTFGAAGVSVQTIPSSDQDDMSVVLPDGSIQRLNGDTDWVTRVLPSGETDLNFGNNGALYLGRDAFSEDLFTIDEFGFMYMGYYQSIQKFTPEGLLVKSFGQNGTLRNSFKVNGGVVKDGYLYLFGKDWATNPDSAIVARMSLDGELDPLFGGR